MLENQDLIKLAKHNKIFNFENQFQSSSTILNNNKNNLNVVLFVLSGLNFESIFILFFLILLKKSNIIFIYINNIKNSDIK